jgi:hypothetical protein
MSKLKANMPFYSFCFTVLLISLLILPACSNKEKDLKDRVIQFYTFEKYRDYKGQWLLVFPINDLR